MCRSPGTCVRLHDVAIYFRSERENMSLSRRCGFHPRARIFLWTDFSERAINASRLLPSRFAGGTLSVQVHDCEGRRGIGIQQEIAFSLPGHLCEINRFRVTLLDQVR
jgi:hypothetical protein